MAAYVIFDVGPSDRDALKPYLERAFDTLIPYGGKVIARTSNIEIREATHEQGWRPNADTHHRVSEHGRSAILVRVARISTNPAHPAQSV